MDKRLYIVEIMKWDDQGEPETFGIIQNIPFSGDGVALEVWLRGKPHLWKSVSNRYFYPSTEDASSLRIPEDALLLHE